MSAPSGHLLAGVEALRAEVARLEAELTALRRFLEVAVEDNPDPEDCWDAIGGLHPDDKQRCDAYTKAWRDIADAAEAERDRLARVLAVERGDVSQAPRGWAHDVNRRWHRGEDEYRFVVYEWNNRYTWEMHHHDRMVCHGRADHALEAMEAADAAKPDIADT